MIRQRSMCYPYQGINASPLLCFTSCLAAQNTHGSLWFTACSISNSDLGAPFGPFFLIAARSMLQRPARCFCQALRRDLPVDHNLAPWETLANTASVGADSLGQSLNFLFPLRLDSLCPSCLRFEVTKSDERRRCACKTSAAVQFRAKTVIEEFAMRRLFRSDRDARSE
jgi:hypothetical protein